MNQYKILEELNKRAKQYTDSKLPLEQAQIQALQDFKVSHKKYIPLNQSDVNFHHVYFKIKE